MKVHFTKLIFLFTIIASFLFNSCQNDFETIENDENTIKIEHFDIEKNAALKNFINNSFTSISQKRGKEAKFLENSDINIDIETALFVADVDNNINYSFRFYPADAAENEIYNLIVNFLANGQKQTFVEKYVCDLSSFENFKANDFHFQYFKGTVSTYDANNFFTKTLNPAKTDGQPCPPVLVTTIGNGGLPGTGNIPIVSGNNTYMPNISIPSHTSGGILGGSGVSFAYIVTPASSNTSGSGSGTTCCGGKGCKVKPGVPQTQTGGTNKTENNPCITYLPVGPVVAVTHPSTIQSIKAKLPNLTTDQFIWLRSNANMQPGIHSLLSGNSPLEEAKVLEIIDRVRQEPEVFKNINPFIIEKQIDDSALSPCVRSIIEKIKNSNQNDFAEMIAKLGGATSPYTVKMIPVSGSPNSNILAETHYEIGSNFNTIIIEINSNYLSNATQLAIANTIQHEIIHANFLSIFTDQINTGNSAINNFPSLWDLYVNSKWGLLNTVHHNLMASSYINVLASALQEFNTNIPVPNGVSPQQFYQDISWAGLEDTNPYLTPYAVAGALTPQDKDRIEAIILAEHRNQTQNVNGIIANPTSIPCN